MKIEITNKHIENGFKQNCGACPIALAFKEQTGHKVLAVTNQSVVFYGKGFDDSAKVIALPHSARDFVYMFDKGMKVRPFSFEIDVNLEQDIDV